MDIFAHALWTNALARGANKVYIKDKKKFRVNVAWTAFWGVFPDLFAFSIPIAYAILRVTFTSDTLYTFAGNHGAVAGFDLAHFLYQYSHSLVIWAVVFLVVWACYKRPRYELLGWLLHILIDIPSHVLTFYPTPFLFPISSYHFPYGVAWSNQWYMLINYSLLAVVWIRIFTIKNLKLRKAHEQKK